LTSGRQDQEVGPLGISLATARSHMPSTSTRRMRRGSAIEARTRSCASTCGRRSSRPFRYLIATRACASPPGARRSLRRGIRSRRALRAQDRVDEVASTEDKALLASATVRARRRAATISSYPRVGWLTISYPDPANTFLSPHTFSRTALAAFGCSMSPWSSAYSRLFSITSPAVPVQQGEQPPETKCQATWLAGHQRSMSPA
jgi:hypothetical protein